MSETAPHTNRTLERAVLSAILTAGQGGYDVAARYITTQSVFSLQKNRAVWHALCVLDNLGLMQQGEVTTEALLLEAMRRHSSDRVGGSEHENLLDIVDGGEYLIRIAETGGTPGTLQRDCEILVELYRERLTMREIKKAAAHSFNDIHRPSDVWAETCAKIEAIGRTRDCVMDYYEAEERRSKSAEAEAKLPNVAMTWGVEKLDNYIPLKLGRYDVAGARPGHGKTTLGLQSAARTAALGTLTAFVSLELNAEDVAEKLHAHDMSRCGDMLKIVAGMDMNPGELRQLCARLGREGVRLIVVDYLQLVSKSNPRETEYQTVTDASRALMSVARDERIAILALAQLNRETDKAKGQRAPVLSDLRGSGGIEQDANRVLFIHLDGDYNQAVQSADLIIAKNRWGRCGAVPTTFDKPRGLFYQFRAAENQPHDLKDKEPSDDEHLFC